MRVITKQSEEFITITAIDKHSSDTMSRSFATIYKLKSMINEWEKEIPYRRYELVAQDFIEDYSNNIQEVLDELEVSN